MSASRMFIAVFILGIGFVGAYFIFINTTIDDGFVAAESAALVPSVTGAVNDLVSAGKPSLFSPSGDDENITQKFAQTFFTKVQSSGIDPDSRALPDNIGSLAEQFSSEAFSEDAFSFVTARDILDSNLQISSDQSIGAKQRYLDALAASRTARFEGFEKTYVGVVLDTYRELDSSSARTLSTIYRGLVDDHMAVAVPVDWMELHKQLLAYYRNAEQIYSAMENYQNDPLKGYLALEFLDGVLQQGVSVQELFEERRAAIN